MTTPFINVGILRAKEIAVSFSGSFLLNGEPVDGGRVVFVADRGRISYCGGVMADEVTLSPISTDSRFTLHDVTIGIDFHWQQNEDQTFAGELHIVMDEDVLQAINRVAVEDYLLSVISSEMNASAPEEFLKAHAVISRSWALAQIRPETESESFGPMINDEETVTWYDHLAHTLFDVCADDHCQRYQGCVRASTPAAAAAIEATRGQVLTFGDELCDARFSKCCGGITERFSTCWQPVDKPYLQAIKDSPEATAADVSAEEEASRWILSSPDAFCARPSEEVLATVLNSYDRSTPHLYRWSVSYTARELADIVRRRSGIDYGDIIEIKALHRGPSGRIDRLRIEGTLRCRNIGRELEIRRTLSESHLYSSAFVARAGERDERGVPRTWTFDGAGWGHGVGLCQIGAAVMATRGYGYKEILAHYFPGSELSRLY